MDKFFIQAAFKSLDDIYKDENSEIRKALTESRQREIKKRKEFLKQCVGNPEVNKDAFNHATDVGASSPTTGLGENIDKTKFNLKDQEEVEEAIAKKNEGNTEEDLVIIHPLLNHKKPSPGNAIITCNSCGEVFYLDKNNLKQDEEDPSVYNKEMQCENCGANDGYEYIGDVSLADTPSAEKVKEERADIEGDNFIDDTEDKVKDVAEENLEEVPEEETEEEEVEEFIEESFDRLINKYAQRIYENLKEYKTSSVSKNNNTYIIEGKLTLNNGDAKNTEFLLEEIYNSKKYKCFKGHNKDLVESKAPFRFVSHIKNGKLIFESFKYRYPEKIDKEYYLIEGFERNNNK